MTVYTGLLFCCCQNVLKATLCNIYLKKNSSKIILLEHWCPCLCTPYHLFLHVTSLRGWDHSYIHVYFMYSCTWVLFIVSTYITSDKLCQTWGLSL